MYLFYIDDSGDDGLKSEGSPTDAFVLSALIVSDDEWLTTLDEVVDFRRFLRDQFGLRMRDELKAGYLVHGAGPFDRLGTSDSARMRIYKMALRLQRKLGTLKTWAIVIHKDRWESQKRGDSTEMRRTAWGWMIQRIEAFTRHGRDTCIIFPDEGHPQFVRRMLRQMRRFSPVPSLLDPSQSLSRPATFVVEDPNFRQSHESYLIQLADLNAYAAYRAVFSEPFFGHQYWEELGDARIWQVSKYRPRGPVGIVLWPPE